MPFLISSFAILPASDLHDIPWQGLTELLVTYGVDFCKEDRYGLTPLFLAKNKGIEGEEVFKYLLGEGAPYNETKSVDVAAAEAEIAEEMAKLAAAQEAALAEQTAGTSSSS